MDATHGAATVDVMPLNLDTREYSVFQAVFLVLQHLQSAHPTLGDAALFEHIEFQANPSFGFPGCDVDRVELFEEYGELRARIRLNLLSLMGAGSPLPVFYSDQALGDSGNGNLTREFLNLFADRLQRLLLPTWQKYRYYTRFQSGANDPFSNQVFALIGLGGEVIRDAPELNWKRLLPYLGLLSLRAHSAALIESVLRYYFKHGALVIEQCVEREASILDEQLNRLGSANSRLSQSLVLGTSVRDRGGKFRIHVRELSWEQLHDFLPTGVNYQPLCALVRFTLRDPLNYDIRLELRPEEIRELRIGADNPCRLGWTSWLGKARADGVVTLASQKHTGGTR
ncbi:type VI secretion system baseplate subunit TssG [Pseudomonas sp. NPDC098747]|uniref:type VI secretion system baseplate subunit TssG n=1 Tax=Pseudomonas sp. NPDC098747 TaxID=3364487 RepID=UPI00383A58E1